MKRNGGENEKDGVVAFGFDELHGVFEVRKDFQSQWCGHK